MQAIEQMSIDPRRTQLTGTLVGGTALMLLTLLIGAFFVIEESGGLDGYPYFFLLPWVLGLALLFATPTAILLYKGQFSITHPLVYVTWSYLFPAFVLGGLFLASGLSRPYFLDLIENVEYTLPYTLILVGAGYLGLCL